MAISFEIQRKYCMKWEKLKQESKNKKDIICWSNINYRRIPGVLFNNPEVDGNVVVSPTVYNWYCTNKA